MRAVVVILATAMAIQPTGLLRAVRYRLRPILVAVDCSASMDLRDMPGSATRRTAVERHLLAPGALLDRLSRSRDVLTYRFSDLLLPLASRRLPPGADRTDLRVALEQLHAEAGLASPDAIVVVSDGVDTEGLTTGQAARLARGLPPVFAVLVGGDGSLPNRELVGLRCPRRVRAGEKVTATAIIRSATEPGAAVSVRWRTSAGQGGPAAAQLGADGVGSANFTLSFARPGRHRIEVRLDGLTGETTAEDNELAVLMEVLPGRRLLVYLDAAPRPEMAALRRLLASLEEVQVRVAVRKASRAWWQELPRMRRLAAPNAIKGFDSALAYVLGNPGRDVLPRDITKAIARRVSSGQAALCVLGGPNAATLDPSLRRLLPASLRNHSARALMTRPPAPGPPLHLDATLYRDLPALAGANLLGPTKPGSLPVLKSETGLLIACLRDDGVIRSAVVATDSLYRWVFSAAASNRSSSAYRDFWLKLLAWLLKPPQSRPITLLPHRLTVLSGEAIILSALVSPTVDEAWVEVSRQGETVRKVSLTPAGPGLMEAEVTALPAGRYTLQATASGAGKKLGEDQVQVTVAAASAEWRWPQPERELLSSIARATGGKVLDWPRLQDLPRLLPQHREAARISVRVDPARGLGAALAIIALLVMDWLLRRRWGLV